MVSIAGEQRVSKRHSPLGPENRHQRGSGNPNSRDQVNLLADVRGRSTGSGPAQAQTMSIHSTIFTEDLPHANYCF